MITLGVIGLIFFLVGKVQSGSGTEHYLSMAGYKVSYLQALIMFGAIPILMLIGLIVAYFAHSDERDFKKKYKIKDD